MTRALGRARIAILAVILCEARQDRQTLPARTATTVTEIPSTTQRRHKTVKKVNDNHRAGCSSVPILISGATRISVIFAGTRAIDSFGRPSHVPTSVIAGIFGTVLRLLLLLRQQIGSLQNLCKHSPELSGKRLRRIVLSVLPAARTILVLLARSLLDLPRSVVAVLSGKKCRLDRAPRLSGSTETERHDRTTKTMTTVTPTDSAPRVIHQANSED